MTQTLNINDTQIEPGRITLGTYGSVGVDRLTFAFSSEWDGLLTKLTFYPAYGSPVEVLTGDEVVVPAEMYKSPGVGKLVVNGYKIENNTLVKRKYTLPCELEVPSTIVNKGKNAVQETASVYEQLRKQMEREITDTLQEAKDSGEFDGAAATVAIGGTITLPSSEGAYVTNSGTENAAILFFGVPQGKAGEQGERGESGVYVAGDGETESDVPADADIALFPSSQSITLLDGRGIENIERTSGTGGQGSTDTYTITYSDDTTSTFTVVNGKDGSGFTIKGFLAASSSLPTTASAGDAYFVGTASPYDVYVYDGLTSAWKSIGAMNGIKGENGNGISSVTKVSSGAKGGNDVYRITFTDGGTFDFNVYVAKDGTNGTNGAPGVTGNGISSIQKVSGTGAAGTTDTYTILCTDGSSYEFTVYNGLDGDGATITIDSTVTSTGANAVSGKAVYDYIADILGDFDAVSAQMATLIGG